MSTDDIVTSFAEASEAFPVIQGQPNDADLVALREKIYPILLEIKYDREGGTHNLVGLIDDDADYQEAYGATFPKPQRVGVYDTTIASDATDGVRRTAEKRHEAKIHDFDVFNVAQREVRKFILSKVEETWVLELKDDRTFYTTVTPKALLDHLQSSCLGTHAVDAVALMTDMRGYHKKADNIHEYINMLEAAQRRAGRIKKKGSKANPITEDILLDIATAAALETQQFPRTNEEWEDLLEHEKTYAKWKGMYKAAQGKAHVRQQAGGGATSFGGNAAAAAAGGDSQPFGGIAPAAAAAEAAADEAFSVAKLEACFDNLANSAKAEASTLAELVKSNSALTASTKLLAATNEKLTKKVDRLENDVARLKKKCGEKVNEGGGAGGGAGRGSRGRKKPTRPCVHCKGKGGPFDGEHYDNECLELPGNADNRPTNWKTCL